MSTDPFAPIAPHLKTSYKIPLYLKEKTWSLSGDSGSVKDENGNIVFKVDAKRMSLSQRRDLVDANGNIVGQLRRKKSPALHKALYIGTPDDEKHCMVKLKGTFNITTCDADIYLGDEVIGEVSGNWRAKEYSIKVNDTVIADAKRKRTTASTFMGADSYCIEIEKGVDTAFVTLITLAFDEMYNDK